MPLTDVKTIAVRKVSAGRTVGLVGGILGGFVLLMVLACTSNSGNSNYAC